MMRLSIALSISAVAVPIVVPSLWNGWALSVRALRGRSICSIRRRSRGSRNAFTNRAVVRRATALCIVLVIATLSIPITSLSTITLLWPSSTLRRIPPPLWGSRSSAATIQIYTSELFRQLIVRLISRTLLNSREIGERIVPLPLWRGRRVFNDRLARHLSYSQSLACVVPRERFNI